MEIASKCPSAREAQVSRVAEVQDRLAGAFAQRSKDEVSAHVLAGLTLTALSLAYRVWFRQRPQDIGAAVQQVLAQFSGIVCGERAGAKTPTLR
jgi:hypothetical protein